MKIILATNIAESSLTVDGVNIVIDAGLGKFPAQSLWAGLPVLKLQRVSQASCTQRAGRAARQGPGVVVRLFSEADFRARPAFDLPEILRLDLTQTLLEVACVVDRPGQGPALDVVSKLTWVDPPDIQRVAAGVILLGALGAVDGAGHVTKVGHEMSRYPLHPRLSRIIEEGKCRDLLAAAVTFAAKVSEQAQGGRSGGYGFAALFQQIARLAGSANLQPVEIPSSGSSLQAFTPVILAGYGDRVARREGDQNNVCSYRLADGRTFVIKQSAHVLPEWLCLIDADVSPSDVSRIMPREWVALAMTPDFTALQVVEGLWKESPEVDWDTGASGAGGRVRGFNRVRFGALVLKETPTSVDPDLAATRLRDELRRAWPRPFADADEVQRWDQRLRVLAELHGEAPLLDLSGEDFEFLLDAMVEGKSSFAEITERGLGEYIKDLLGYASAERVLRECPEKIELASGRSALVHYRAGQPPWVEGKIQEFFGGKPLPSICGGKAKLVVHLLAPNNRPVQVTSDLDGFWKNHYPALRRELSRDYPRHFWPEDPLTAEARVFLRPRR